MPTPGQMDEVHQTLVVLRRDGFTTNNVIDFGKQFPIGNKLYDIRKVGDLYHELKNKSFTLGGALETGDIDQVINGYIKNINNMSEFKWEAGFSKIKSVWSTTNDAKAALKTKWQNAFKANATDLWDVVNQNTLLKTDLGLTGSNNNAAGLNSLINDTSSKLYNFVTVQ